MEQAEQKFGSRVDDPVFIETIRQQFADAWEEIVTGEGQFSGRDFMLVEKIRQGKKVPVGYKGIDAILIRIGQDHRLIPDEIDQLKKTFLEYNS